MSVLFKYPHYINIYTERRVNTLFITLTELQIKRFYSFSSIFLFLIDIETENHNAGKCDRYADYVMERNSIKITFTPVFIKEYMFVLDCYQKPSYDTWW